MKSNQFLLIILGIIIVSCSGKKQASETSETEEQIVNLYSHRHYETDKELYKKFEESTGIKVNIVQASADELITRMEAEGQDSPADLLLTVDAGRLHRAYEKDLFQPISSEALNQNIPSKFREPEGHWFGLTYRARIVVHDKDRVDPSELSTYEALTDPKWQGKVLIRSSSNIYNQSLMASIIAANGKDGAKEWATGVMANMARDPQGSDRDQMKAIVAGEGDIAVVNTYYLGLLLNSSDPEEVKVGEQMKVFFPNQEGRGAHINVSGIGVAKYAPNKENAIKLLEFLSGEEAQKVFAQVNYEYPVNPKNQPSELLQSWGSPKFDDLNLAELGKNNRDAVITFDEVGWK